MSASREFRAGAPLHPPLLHDAATQSMELSDLREILEDAPIGIHWVDSHGIVIWANRTELEMLGYERDEFVGHHLSEFHVDADAFAELLKSLQAGATIKGYEARLRHKDGSIRIGSINSNVVWHGDQFVHTRCFTRDVTEAKVLEQQARNHFGDLENLYRTVPVGLALFDPSLRFVRASERLAEINGSPVEQHLGRNLRDILPELADLIEPVLREVLASGRPSLGVEFEGETSASPGKRRVWSANYYPVKAACGDIVGVNVSVEEITERKRAEAALAESARIKDALYRLTDRLHRAQDFGDVYEAALSAIISALRCSRASILLFDETRTMRFVGWRGLSDSYREAVDGHSPWHFGEDSAQPIFMSDIEQADLDASLREVIRSECIAALAFIPLISNGKLIGKFMAYFDTPRDFETEDVELAQSIARQLAFGIEHKRSEEALNNQIRQLALISDTAPVFIAYCDVDSRFKFVNKTYAARFGLSPEQVVGRHIADIIGARAYRSIEKYIEIVLRGEPVQFDITVPYELFGDRFMHCSYAAERDGNGKVVGWVSAITDITERKRIEEALQTSEEKLKETDRRKDEFLAMLAHELRNPLAPIANSVHLLRAGRGQDIVQQQATAIIERQSGRLARLVDDLLEVSRITTGRIRLHLEDVSVSGIVERSVETVRPMIEQYRHALTVTLPEQALWVRADAARLEQVIVNLLTNAIKYTDHGGHIDLAVHREDGEVLVRVKDTGIGIGPDLLPHIFDLFTQSERSLDRSHGGLGVGLSIVQRLVLMHGGTVTAESAPGKGSEFIVRLPAISVPGLDATSVSVRTEGSASQARSLRVLVVDDNVDAAQSLSMLLQSSGHSVLIAHDGLAAVETAKKHVPHVIMLDIGLPKLDGYAVAASLRAEPTLHDAVFIAVTGYGQLADREQAVRAGFDRHLVKPVDFAAVEQILVECARKTRRLQ